MKQIVQRENPVLRKVAKEVSLTSIKTPRIKKILREMSESLASVDDGVAIAAPQIGYSLRIFVVSGKIFERDFEKKRKNRLEHLEAEVEEKEKKVKHKDLVFINPKITKLSKEKTWLPEGCLSVRWLYGKVHRAKKASVIAYDENGKKFARGASGLLAQIFQHETDHLNGVLFIDQAKEVRDEPPNYAQN